MQHTKQHTNLRIALDGMGTDEYPYHELHGASIAASEFGCQVLITGDKALLQPVLNQITTARSAHLLRIVHAPERIEMAENPVFASRVKRESSIAIGLQLLRDGEADAFVSAGNTGAILANGLFILRRLPGARRPALTVLLPIPSGRCVFLDIGANTDCKPEYLEQFAVMGSLYAKRVVGIPTPRVALLSNGEEASKGNELVKAAYPMLKNNTALNFVGNIEGKEMFEGAADVVVADGFTGNIALKITEAATGMISGMIKDAMRSTAAATLGGFLARSAIRRTLRPLNPNQHGGAPLLGLNGIVIVAHGRSNAHAIRSAIKAAQTAIRQNMLAELKVVLSDSPGA